jgi:ribonucleotide monophosphatase NagD (HAD superfamily)
MTRLIDGLACVASDYDVLLCDVWGVIHNGRESFPTACAALTRWRAERGPVLLISNSPRPGPEVAAQLDGLTVPRDSWTTIVTSGDATRGLLPEDYRAILTRAAARDLEMVCANPDRVVQRGDRLIFCGGALADLYEHLGGRVAMAGKPFAPIYDLALSLADQALGRPLDRSRVLAIGDGLATDIAGAQAQGLDRLFIAAGIHGAEVLGADGRLSAEAVDDLLADAELTADFAMADLAW